MKNRLLIAILNTAFHDKRHPGNISGKEIAEFLTCLAVDRKVSASTQNQALNALVFMYEKVLKITLDGFDFKRARTGSRLPGEYHLMADKRWQDIRIWI